MSNQMNSEKKLFRARVLLAIALILGVISTFLDWELLQPDGCWRGPISRSFFDVISGILYGAWCEIGFHFVYVPNLRFFLPLYLLVILLAPIFLARIFSQSRILWWLWAFVFVSSFLFFIFSHQRAALYTFVYSYGRLDNDTHISWLSGMYVCGAAVVLHLLGMVMIYFSSPRLNIA